MEKRWWAVGGDLNSKSTKNACFFSFSPVNLDFNFGGQAPPHRDPLHSDVEVVVPSTSKLRATQKVAGLEARTVRTRVPPRNGSVGCAGSDPYRMWGKRRYLTLQRVASHMATLAPEFSSPRTEISHWLHWLHRHWVFLGASLGCSACLHWQVFLFGVSTQFEQSMPRQC